MASSSYAAFSDMQQYIPELSTNADTTIITTLLSTASRLIDLKTGQYFYADGFSTKYFDGDGGSMADTGKHPFYSKAGTIAAIVAGATSISYTVRRGPAPLNGDVLVVDQGSVQESLTINGAVTGAGPYTCPIVASTYAHGAGTTASTLQLKLAYFENQPLANWLGPLPGDGFTPPSNFWLYPANPKSAESTADANALRPYWGIELATIPVAGTNYLPSYLPGHRTWSLGAHWGWSVVPDVVKDMTCKVTARAWRARGSGWATQIGDPSFGGVIDLSKFFDQQDYWVLKGADLVLWSQG